MVHLFFTAGRLAKLQSSVVESPVTKWASELGDLKWWLREGMTPHKVWVLRDGRSKVSMWYTSLSKDVHYWPQRNALMVPEMYCQAHWALRVEGGAVRSIFNYLFTYWKEVWALHFGSCIISLSAISFINHTASVSFVLI